MVQHQQQQQQHQKQQQQRKPSLKQIQMPSKKHYSKN
jgi:hypothetical protein